MKTNIFNVAEFILEQKGSMSAMKLQKLVYYSQAWALVWDDKELFDNRIEAWANGPVSPELYDKHRNSYTIYPEMFSLNVGSSLSEEAKETISTVLEAYGDKSAQWLSDQTHEEQPWKEARRGLSDMARSNRIITCAAMAEYYGSIV